MTSPGLSGNVKPDLRQGYLVGSNHWM